MDAPFTVLGHGLPTVPRNPGGSHLVAAASVQCLPGCDKILVTAFTTSSSAELEGKEEVIHI